MANNLAVTEQADQYGGAGGWVFSITDQTGSGAKDSFSATGLGANHLKLVERGVERFSALGAGILELTETNVESFAATMTYVVTGDFAVNEKPESVAFTMTDHGIPMTLAVAELNRETLAFAMIKATGNVFAVSEWPGDTYEGDASTISDAVLRHVRNSV